MSDHPSQGSIGKWCYRHLGGRAGPQGVDILAGDVNEDLDPCDVDEPNDGLAHGNMVAYLGDLLGDEAGEWGRNTGVCEILLRPGESGLGLGDLCGHAA